MNNKNRFVFSDGSVADENFFNDSLPEISKKRYVITDYHDFNGGEVSTEKIQNVIDVAAENGGGVLVIPSGEFLSGALFFKQGVDLCVEKGGVLKGSDDISDYPLCKTRIEGETCEYFPALINACGLTDFSIFGDGIIDGNGLKSWKSFWMRIKWKPSSVNKDEQRARLVFISNCKNVCVSGVTMQNSQFWTLHFYKSDFIKVVGCSFYSPHEGVCAPSTDAIDVDACRDVYVTRCKINVNDDGVVLKGGKGPYADSDDTNGANERIIINDCLYEFCYGCLTCGSESIHDKNVILCNSKVLSTYNLLWLKMRTDTPQLYENIRVYNVFGRANNFIDANPWMQYFDLKGRKDVPLSEIKNVFIENCAFECDNYFNVNCDTYFGENGKEQNYRLSNFYFDNLKITAKNYGNADSESEIVKKTNVTVTISE
ncbi:MAG: glycosyl hydrolase family 28 protein [Candidatus Borkfalkiaceae bacterium]|nr:glycosyl hydrolase family 28 protein [Christensenellaceae bacterium]